MKDLFEKILEGYNSEWDKIFRNKLILRDKKDPYLNEIINFLKKNCVRKIISIPSGDGINEDYLQKKGFFITCIDISGEILKKLEKRIKNKKRIEIIKADIFNLGKKIKNSKEAILSLDFVFHIAPKLRRFLKTVKNILKKGGFFIFNFYTSQDDGYGKGTKIGRNTFKFKPNILIKYYTLYEIKNLLNGMGFKTVKVVKYTRKDPEHFGFRKENKKYHTHRGYLVFCAK